MSTNPKRTQLGKTLLFLGVAVFVVFFDQLTKILAVENLQPFESVPFIFDFVRLNLVFNDSAAFSLGGSATWVFTLLSSLASLALLWFGPKFRTSGWLILIGMALGGVVGNLIDRLFRNPGFPNGHVVDFIQVPLNFPIFNIADSAITIAASIIAIRIIRGEKLGGKSD
ncbi:MAG: signal peptidase II [Rhodoluna sp.]|nr:signal peptidase II [Rhodoluna sp.]